MNICTKLVSEIIAIAHPMKITQSNTKEVALKNYISIMYFPKINILSDVNMDNMKFTMKKLTQ